MVSAVKHLHSRTRNLRPEMTAMKRMYLLLFLAAASLGLAQAPPVSRKPLTKDQVLSLVRNQLGDESGAKLIEQRGIDFEPTEDFIKSLQGASASEVFVQALRAARRVAPAGAGGKKPLDQIQVVALLAGGVPNQRVAMLVNERGISFEPTEDYLWTLKNVGAEDVLLGAVRAAKRAKPEALSAEVAAKHAKALSHLARGAELADKKKLYPEAEQEFRAALALEPGNPDLHFALGYVLYEQKKWDLAAAEYRTCIRLQPDLALAHHHLGLTLDKKRDLDGAIAEYRTAIRLQPDDAKAHYNLGRALGGKGDLDGAIVESRTAIRLEPDDALAHSMLGLGLERKGDPDGAIAEYNTAIRLQPDDAISHLSLGFALGRRGGLDRAIAEYNTAIRLQPDNADAHNRLGAALRDGPPNGKYGGQARAKTYSKAQLRAWG